MLEQDIQLCTFETIEVIPKNGTESQKMSFFSQAIQALKFWTNWSTFTDSIGPEKLKFVKTRSSSYAILKLFKLFRKWILLEKKSFKQATQALKLLVKTRYSRHTTFKKIKLL